MDLQKLNKTSDIKLNGITVELERIGGSIRGIKLADGNGGLVLVRRDNSYSEDLAVLGLAPPKTAKRHRVTATLVGVSVDEVFKTATEAESRRDELEEAGSEDAKVTETEVPEED